MVPLIRILRWVDNWLAGFQIKNDPNLKRLLVTTASTGAQYRDYLTLYRYVRKHKPKEVLEFGPGVTTLFIAQALRENGVGRVTAIENQEKYFNETKNTIPESLAPFIDLRLSGTREYRHGAFVSMGYAEIPDRPYEFVWVDGPTVDGKTAFNIDLIEIVKRGNTIDAMVDGRRGSVFMYSLLFGKDKVSFNRIRQIGWIHGVTRVKNQIEMAEEAGFTKY